jgi:hemerythrin-like domain-containing protein
MDALDRTHRQILQLIGEFGTLVERVAQGEPDAETRKIAQRLCNFFGGEARKHHADEERIVFPELIALGDAELTQHVLRLQQDHGWIEEDWFEIEPLLQAIAQGMGSVDVELLRSMLEVFEPLLREHIALEETTVYPTARRRREEAAARQQGAR